MNDEAPRRRWLDRDLVVAVMSGFIGLLALGVSTFNVTLQQKQVRAQVWPRLLIMPSYFNGRLALDVRNGGIGPAQIEKVRMSVDGHAVPDWHAVILRLTDADLKPGSWGWSTLHGALVSPGQTMEALIVENPAVAEKLFAQHDRLTAEVCYCSALQECWVLENNQARSVARCPVWPDAFEQ